MHKFLDPIVKAFPMDKHSTYPVAGTIYVEKVGNDYEVREVAHAGNDYDYTYFHYGVIARVSEKDIAEQIAFLLKNKIRICGA